MALKNLQIYLSNGDPQYVSSDVRYARIDNTVSPVYTTVVGVTSNPFVVSGVDNGQYRIYAKPNFSDGRICPEVMIETEPCTGINALSAAYDDPNIVVSYSAEDSLPQVKVNISYPNGGFSSSVHTNDGNDIPLSIPSELYGTYFVTMQPVCDEDTGFVGPPTQAVTVEVPEPSP